MGNTKENILAALELALAEIINVGTLNTWVSVKDRSINKILAQAGVNRNYSSVVLDELKKLGLAEGEGERSGMRYKIISNIIPDVSNLALVIYQRFNKKIKDYNDRRTSSCSEGYPESEQKDLFPIRFKKEKEEKHDPKTLTMKRQVIIPNLGDMRFIVRDNKIIEGKIISLFYGEDDKSILYSIRIINEDWIIRKDDQENNVSLEEISKYEVIKDLGVKALFETPEIAAEHLIRRVVRYSKY